MDARQFARKIVQKVRTLSAHVGATPYSYASLDEAAREIRLMELHPGSPKDPIRVSLSITPFTSDHVPMFEALSYTWGSPKKQSTIFVGKSGCETLSITQNLAEALPYLRYEDKPRVLWIDAICVNQQDLKERGQQVKRIAEISTKATRVVARLGPESKTTARAIECFNDIASHIDVNLSTQCLIPLSDCDAPWTDLAPQQPFDEASYSAILDFISSEWFQRLWIVQEIRLSSQESVLLRGRQLVKWTLFRKVSFFLHRKLSLLNISFDLYSLLNARLMEIYPLGIRGAYPDLRYLMQATKTCKCSDPRDRVFALISLLDSPLGYGFELDYNKHFLDVYRDVHQELTPSHNFRMYAKGYRGLAPEVARSGDIITVLLGCPNPMILRATTEGFKVVGEAYCDVLMSGEALLGSLPPGFELILTFAESAGYYRRFVNSKASISQVPDPRLSQIPFPPGWRVQSHDSEEDFAKYVNDITGENSLYDPRLAPDALRQRGVEIQTFDLI
ncbi:uncharacterized protein LY89DRAFT_790395 [Mollisia scopiformis]|uniref:WW domain-containing protein n=1 Tax=Mollisia scopiformis TaxID=149040 RepID=A0A132B299_MOLSC|nr:uncharacterized protein LY89DRAFT_790395 [Mollisia scopiformis]KUJ06525.1 hypothetical protein LY89DRAFT_790395 [Mollisia scopiformis]